METASLKELLREHIELKGLTPKKIADMAGIPDRYIEMLLEGDASRLPPAPYVHGYIAKLSGILNFDKDTMWRLYQKESRLTRSGNEDRLPNNRFAAHRISRAWVVALAVILVVVAFGGYNAYGILTPPAVVITVPASDNSTVAQETILLQGKTNAAYTVTVNGSEVYVGPDGSFQKELQLQEGVNSVEFVVRKFLGKETHIVRHIVYAPAPKTELIIQTNKKTNANQNATTTGEGQ
jgi:cytoskeletal protein RodZ